MRKYVGMLLLAVLIAASAVWGAQQIRLFQRMTMIFGSFAFAAEGAQHQDKPPRPDAQEFQAPTHPDEGSTERPGRHTMAASSERWMNVMAYVAVFAFVVLLTYYGEQGLCKFAHRREPCLPSP